MKNCISIHRLLYSLAMLAALASIASTMNCEQREATVRYSAQSDQNERRKGPPLDYYIWRVLRPDNKGFTLAFVSVSPDHFNREAMTALAGLLNERFNRKGKIKAILFDDHVLAKNYASGAFDPTAMEDFVRGLYFLDRSKPEEYIQFSSERNKAIDEITVKLNPTRGK